QNFMPYTVATWLDTAPEGLAQQLIAQGPAASQVAIKMLGTNGGGFFNANAAHPFENPTPLSNFLQMLSIFLIPSAMTYYLGLKVKNQKHGWAVWSAMTSLFLAMFILCWWAESSTNPHLTALGIDSVAGNMEGKEVRFGIFGSSLFATITTSASCGAVNAMHDSFTPIGGFTTMLNMQFGEVIFGGVGAGLYGMLIFVVLAIFIAGLMVGRTPEYLGKKIEGTDVKASALYILVAAISILGFTAWAAASQWGVAGLNNAGPHGFSEMLYAFTSATSNNGSAFAGLTANTSWYDNTLGFAMLIGRFFLIVPVLALAGNLSRKKLVGTTVGSFPVSGVTFTILLIGTVVIVGALTFLPALALGPIVEHFLMNSSTKLF
ncbi:MAG: potassium-transporting ATPase subunit A, partial [Chitinophagaceae bacterium]|nr:potassium-transporting ATPase subunit A [Oligoflexus sp.]